MDVSVFAGTHEIVMDDVEHQVPRITDDVVMPSDTAVEDSRNVSCFQNISVMFLKRFEETFQQSISATF